MSSKKSSPSVKVVNPRALPPGVNLSPDPIANVLPPEDRVTRKQLPRSRQLTPGGVVKVVGKAPSPFVPEP